MKIYIIILSGVFLLMTSCRSNQDQSAARAPVTVTAFEVRKQTIPAAFEFVGVAKSSHPVEIRARVEGYLWSINYVEGSAVKENDLLFQLDPRPFEASLQEAVGVLEKEEAILWRAKRSLERIEPLFKKNAVSQRDLDDAIAGVLAAEASVTTAKGNLLQAELNLSYTKVQSPINGLSGRAAFREGTLITPGVNGLLTLVSVIDPIWVLFSISDNQRLQGEGEQRHQEIILPPAQEYTVELELSDGTRFPHKGKVNFSSPTLDPKTGSLVVRATFANPEGLILPGQFVKAHVYGASRPDAIFVPQQSVFQGNNGMYVFVIDAKGIANLRSVEVGDWYETYWVIKAGLQEGDVVVVEGTNKITEGAKVEVTSVSSIPAPKIPQRASS
jgi:membrane fusion protein (multidrug efflux system)